MKWIKCEDGLPDKSGQYIGETFLLDDGFAYRPVSYNYFNAETKEWSNRFKQQAQVTKWLDESEPIALPSQPEQNRGQEEKVWVGEINSIPINKDFFRYSFDTNIGNISAEMKGKIRSVLESLFNHTPVSSEEGKELFNNLDGAILTQPMSDKKEEWKEYFINNVNRTKNQLLVFDVIWEAATRATPSTPQGEVEQAAKEYYNSHWKSDAGEISYEPVVEAFCAGASWHSESSGAVELDWNKINDELERSNRMIVSKLAWQRLVDNGDKQP